LERERVSGISAAVRAARLGEEFAQNLINNGVNLNDSRAKIIEELAKRSDATATETQHTGRVDFGTDARDKMRASLQNAIEYRSGVAGAKLNDGGREFAGMTLLEMGREVMTRTGSKIVGADRMELAALALGMRVERFSGPGYAGTTDFPYVLANVMNKSLRAAYEAYPQTWKPIAMGTTVTDFKAKYVNQLSESPTPVEVPASGEFKYVKLTDKRESYAIKTYGNIIALNRQAIINDDLSAFNRIPSLQGRACAMMESDIVWALITSNPTMGADSTALFHANHGNLAASGTVINQTSMGAMRAAMRVQKNVQSIEYLNVEPRYIAVPAAIETVALQQTSQQFVPQQGSNVNTFKNLNVIVEPRLDANSATAWYGFADPSQVAIIEYAYLAGQEGIYTEMRVGFDVDGVEMKVREDFGAQILDWRGCYKNVGA
jgi:phage major head subunit gpT-like protein